MQGFLEAKSIRLRENHAGEGVYVSLDGRRIPADRLTNLYGSLRELSPLTTGWYSSRP